MSFVNRLYPQIPCWLERSVSGVYTAVLVHAGNVYTSLSQVLPACYSSRSPTSPLIMALGAYRCLQTNTQLDEIASRIGEPRDIEDHESREVRPRTGLPCQDCACLLGAPGQAQTHSLRVMLSQASCVLVTC